MEEVAATIRDWLDLGWRAAFGRVIDVQGFGGSSQVELFAVDEIGTIAGGLFAGTLDGIVLPAARTAADRIGPAGLRVVIGDVHAPKLVQAGLACGGTATALVQTADDVPRQFWSALADQHRLLWRRSSTVPAATPKALVIGPDEIVPMAVVADEGALGTLGDPATDEAVMATATALLADGTAAIRRKESELGTVLIEAMVPSPRLVVVGRGHSPTPSSSRRRYSAGRAASPATSSRPTPLWAGPVRAAQWWSSAMCPALTLRRWLPRSATAPSIWAPPGPCTQAARANRLEARGVPITTWPDPGPRRPRSRRPDPGPDRLGHLRRDPRRAHWPRWQAAAPPGGPIRPQTTGSRCPAEAAPWRGGLPAPPGSRRSSESCAAGGPNWLTHPSSPP